MDSPAPYQRLLPPRARISLASVKNRNGKNTLRVCILSPHPLVLAEFSRALGPPAFQTSTRHLDSMLAPELRKVALPRAPVYVVDAHASASGTAALMSNLLERSPSARVLIVAEKFSTNDSHDMLRLGAKGLLTYGEAREQLPRALPLVAGGGFWVPRSLLSEFVDSVITNSRGRRVKVESAAELSRREQEVLDSLLENLANKEIASKLNISERTVKFHVSNLLSKFGVRRRADLILLCYQRHKTGA
jgi:two-component system nitrate/nitrite response regulator NarL